MTNQKTDLFTGQKFIPKRKNQKFSTAQNRIAYNNNKAFLDKESRAFIDKPLRQNHKILLNLLKAGETKSFSKEYLKGKGFSNNVFSHYEFYDNKNCISIYDFILIDINANNPNIKIHRKK